MDSYKDFLIPTLEKAAEIANGEFGKVVSTNKPDNSVLTKTDLEIGKLIINEISKKYPSHNIIDEEAGVINNQSEFTWVIDPIDGTSNFALGLPFYGIMVGLMHNFQPISGAVTLPFFKEIIFAEKNKGAWCNNQRITVTKEENLLHTLISYSFGYARKDNPQAIKDECDLLAQLLLKVRNIRSTNSIYDLIVMAKGKFGAVLNRSTQIWDNVVQQIITEEAGGIYTDFFGQPMDYSQAFTNTNKNYTFCAASPALHKQLQQIIHQSQSKS